MKIVLDGELALTLEPTEGMLTIEAQSADEDFSPFHMLGAGLATCTFAVLYSWAQHSEIPVDDLRLRVEWTFAENPHRLGNMRTNIIWPSLPEARKQAAQRAASLCAVHQTLTHPVTIETAVGA